MGSKPQIVGCLHQSKRLMQKVHHGSWNPQTESVKWSDHLDKTKKKRRIMTEDTTSDMPLEVSHARDPTVQSNKLSISSKNKNKTKECQWLSVNTYSGWVKSETDIAPNIIKCRVIFSPNVYAYMKFSRAGRSMALGRCSLNA